MPVDLSTIKINRQAGTNRRRMIFSRVGTGGREERKKGGRGKKEKIARPFLRSAEQTAIKRGGETRGCINHRRGQTLDINLPDGRR